MAGGPFRQQDAGERNVDANKAITDYSRVIWREVNKSTRDINTRNDLFQDVCVRILEKWDQCREINQPGGWINSVARTVVSSYRYNRRKEPETMADWHDAEIESSEPGPCNALNEKEQLHLVRLALDNLDELHKQVAVAFYVDGKPVLDIAAEYGIPLGTVKRRLYTARERITAALGAAE
jgi:RNA polymerase sigma-70 factor (ECF subfamily)